MMVRFEENEYFLMAMFQKESRQATIEEIHNVIPYIGRDEEMLSLINSTLEKLWFLTDEAFLNMDTIKIVLLGLIAFAVGTATGVFFFKIN